MDVRKEVLRVIGEVLDVREEELKLDEKLYDSLGVDSTEMVELSIAIGKSLGVKLEQKAITNTCTPNQIVEKMEKIKGGF